MGLFPATFVDDLKAHLDIVQVVQERVQLRRAGATWKGLCPFHGEKTPSFHVNGDKGFFHCFGCGVGGDVIKFVELYDQVAFPDAVRQLAARAGLTVPEAEDARHSAESQREREALLKVHEVAAAWFKAQLAAPHGRTARRVLDERAMKPDTIDLLGFGYAPTVGLSAHLKKAGFDEGTLVQSGLAFKRDDGQLRDRFRNRLMIPIARDSGTIVAFGGRALEAGQEPKYYNSPETAIYVKGRTLFGLNQSKQAISRQKHAVVVEGYFDWAQAWQAGIQNVVASSGTALKVEQVRLLRRFATKVVLNFDPDTAGLGAAAGASLIFVSEGFEVNVAVLPGGDDPDNYIRRHGAAAYQEQLRSSRKYEEYLLDRAAADEDLSTDEGRRSFLGKMLTVAARMPDPARRDLFADRLAHKTRITDEVIRAEIRKAAVQRQTDVADIERRVPVLSQIKVAERGLIWALFHEAETALQALAELEPADLAGLATGDILRQAQSLTGWPVAALPDGLVERLSTGEAALVREIAAQSGAPAEAADCVRTLKRLRYEREKAELQREIDHLQETGVSGSADKLNALLRRKEELQRIGHTEGFAR